MFRRFTLVLALMTGPALADMPDTAPMVDEVVLPGYRALATESAALAAAAKADCSPDDPDLRAAYNDAFDSWIRVSHLRFGPSEQGNRAFALAFWPDARGKTPKALAALIADQDPVIETQAKFDTVSIAARGFYALEFLLYDPQFTTAEPEMYRCALLRAVTADIAANAGAILADWEGGYADLMRHPGNDTYRTPAEAAQQFYTALQTGLQFTSDMRLGRPMGSFDRPRPARAEARRSARSLANVVAALEGTRLMAAQLSDGNETLDAAYDRALRLARALNDPTLAGVSDPTGRIRVEALQQAVDHIREVLGTEVAPALGLLSGFNALDGD